MSKSKEEGKNQESIQLVPHLAQNTLCKVTKVFQYIVVALSIRKKNKPASYFKGTGTLKRKFLLDTIRILI